MLAERCLQSEALGKQARDFVAWSVAAGNDLRRMGNMSLEKAGDFAAASPHFRAFPLEKIRVLHHRDHYHYPAVLLARHHTNTETHIQSFNLITGDKQRYAFIVQSENSGDAVSASITRFHPLEPSGVAINFGKRRDLPNFVSNYGANGIHIDLSGRVYAVSPESWGKDAVVDWVKNTLYHLTHGVSMRRLENVRELTRIGSHYAGPTNAGSMASAFLCQPTFLG